MATTFKLYASNGSSLLYTFPVVISANYPHDTKQKVVHSNLRGKGSLVVDGGTESWVLELRGVLSASGYDSLEALIDTLETTVVWNTPYYLKITKSAAGGTTYDYNVKRIDPIEYQNDSLRTDYIEYKINLLVNSW